MKSQPEAGELWIWHFDGREHGYLVLDYDGEGYDCLCLSTGSIKYMGMDLGDSWDAWKRVA